MKKDSNGAAIPIAGGAALATGVATLPSIGGAAVVGGTFVAAYAVANRFRNSYCEGQCSGQ